MFQCCIVPLSPVIQDQIGTGTLSLRCCSAKLHCMQVELNDIPVTVLKKGSYFGEIALLRNVRRTASVRALSETCDLFVLTKVSAAGHSCALLQHRRLRQIRMFDLFVSLSSCALFAHDAQRHTLDCSDEVSLTWQQHLEH